MRILILNAYSVERVSQEIAEGLKPSHHLYGIIELKIAGHELIFIEPRKKGFWFNTGRFLNSIPLLNVGDLDVQLRAYRRRKEYDIVYAPAQTQTIFLGVLAYFKLFDRKIIALAHHPFLRGKLGKYRKYSLYFAIRGHAKWAALSNVVAKEVNQIAEDNIASFFHWGPELRYFDNIVNKLKLHNTVPSVDLIAIGRTGRDYNTLIKAFNNTDIKVEIYCHKEIILDKTTANIRITYLEKPESLSYPELIKLYKNAKILAVPMFAANTLSGLTSVTDAIALGMPLMITYNDFIQIDVEEEGFGYWIKPYDAIAWRNKAAEILNYPETIKRMQGNSRKVSAKFNIAKYTEELEQVINSFK